MKAPSSKVLACSQQAPKLCSECKRDPATTWAFEWMKPESFGNRPLCESCKAACHIVNTSVDDAKQSVKTTDVAGLKRALELELKRSRRASIIRMVERQLALIERQRRELDQRVNARAADAASRRRHFAGQMALARGHKGGAV